MTLDRCVALLKEIRALDRARAALALHGTDPDWSYTLTVLSDRVFLLRGSLSVEDPALISAALDVLQNDQRLTAVAAPPVFTAVTRMIH